MTALLEANKLSLRRVVEAAALAPSAENTQPWRFVASGDRLTICLDRTRALASDVDGMLDLTSLGACLENAVIAFRQAGYEPRVMERWEDNWLDSSCQTVSLVDLEPGFPCKSDSLHRYVEARCTSRRMDGKRPVASSQLAALATAVGSFPRVRVDWITDKRQMRGVAALVGVANRIRFEHKPFHAEFYRNVRFTPDEARQTRDGLDVATLQLPFGVPAILRSMRCWGLIRLANRLGFSRSVQRQARQETCGSGALGILSVDSAEPSAFLEGGRAFQRLWLTGTATGLGLHPAAALPVFLAYAQRTDGSRLLPEHWRMVNEMRERFNLLLPELRHRTVQMVFRLGYAQAANVRSLRRPIDEMSEGR